VTPTRLRSRTAVTRLHPNGVIFGVTGWQVGKKGGADMSAPPFFIQDAQV